MHHIIAAAICTGGVISSCMALIGEALRWKSYGQFSIATKIPVQIFGIKGPLALVSSLIYLVMAMLLISETGTSTVFYFCCSWTVLYLDMAMEWYESWKDMFAPKIDVIIHITNVIILTYSFYELTYFPVTFILAGSGLWGILVLLRVSSKADEANIKA